MNGDGRPRIGEAREGFHFYGSDGRIAARAETRTQAEKAMERVKLQERIRRQTAERLNRRR